MTIAERALLHTRLYAELIPLLYPRLKQSLAFCATATPAALKAATTAIDLVTGIVLEGGVFSERMWVEKAKTLKEKALGEARKYED